MSRLAIMLLSLIALIVSGQYFIVMVSDMKLP